MKGDGLGKIGYHHNYQSKLVENAENKLEMEVGEVLNS
jgi:hypothetical protein